MEEHNTDQANLIKELSIPLYESRGWLKLLGILNIISGVLSAITIVGIIFAWLPIWIGVILYQAGSSSEQAYYSGDKYYFIKSMRQFKLYFTISGVMALLGIILTLVFIIAILVGGFAFGEFWDQYEKYY